MSRAYRSLLILTALTVLATGLVSRSLVAPAAAGSHVQLALSAVLLLASAFLLVRILARLTAGHRPWRPSGGR